MGITAVVGIEPMEVNYFEAWIRWLNGETVIQYYLLGMKILWWGRVGKIIQFLSAVAFIVDIIGEHRLREMSHAFRYTNVHRVLYDRLGNFARKSNFFIGLGLFLIVLSIFAVEFLWGPLDIDEFPVNQLVQGYIGIWTIGLIAGVAGLFIGLTTLLLTRVLALLATVLSSRRYLSIVLLVLIIVGFHFDLLAS